MLSWCSYCQQFVGEVPPYENLVITHSICRNCESKALTLTESDIAHAVRLKAIQSQLFEAGRRGDLNAASEIIEISRQAGTRDVDIVIGVIAPMLYQIGEDWKCGAIRVAEEHRFTAFCEKTLDIVTGNRLPSATLDVGQEKPREILLREIVKLWGGAFSRYGCRTKARRRTLWRMLLMRTTSSS